MALGELELQLFFPSRQEKVVGILEGCPNQEMLHADAGVGILKVEGNICDSWAHLLSKSWLLKCEGGCDSNRPEAIPRSLEDVRLVLLSLNIP